MTSQMGIPSPPPGERKALNNYTPKPVSFVSTAQWAGGAGSTHPGTPGGTRGCRAVGLVPCAHTLRAALGARGSWAQTRSAAVMEAAGADGPRGPSGVSPVHPRLLPAQPRSLLPARPQPGCQLLIPERKRLERSLQHREATIPGLRRRN